jgi:phage gp46-like protein
MNNFMFSVIKPQAPFERLKIANESAEIALSRAIILQAVVDASNTSNNATAKQFAEEALEWIFIDNQNFKEICVSADLEVDCVRSIASKMIALHKNKKL